MKSKLQIDGGAFSMKQGAMPFAIVSPVAVFNPKAQVRGMRVQMPCTAQWDTGATHNLISPKMAKEALLDIYEKTAMVNGINNTSECRVYVGSLQLMHGLVATDQLFIEDRNLENTGIDVVIGLSIINNCDFALTHSQDGNIVLSVAAPPSKYVNFVTNPID